MSQDAPHQTMKCRFCNFVATSTDNTTAWTSLKDHLIDEHYEEVTELEKEFGGIEFWSDDDG